MRPEVLDELESLIGKDLTPIRDPNGTTMNHLKWMIQEMKTGDFSEAKYNRWLGYIQGVLVALGITSLNAERDRNR